MGLQEEAARELETTLETHSRRTVENGSVNIAQQVELDALLRYFKVHRDDAEAHHDFTPIPDSIPEDPTGALPDPARGSFTLEAAVNIATAADVDALNVGVFAADVPHAIQLLDVAGSRAIRFEVKPGDPSPDNVSGRRSEVTLGGHQSAKARHNETVRVVREWYAEEDHAGPRAEQPRWNDTIWCQLHSIPSFANAHSPVVGLRRVRDTTATFAYENSSGSVQPIDSFEVPTGRYVHEEWDVKLHTSEGFAQYTLWDAESGELLVPTMRYDGRTQWPRDGGYKDPDAEPDDVAVYLQFGVYGQPSAVAVRRAEVWIKRAA